MIKLLLCLLFSLTLGVVVLQLRQQRMELNHQALALHNEIEARQAKLWSQQLQIAVYTAPNAIAQTMSQPSLHMATAFPVPPADADPDPTPAD
jgi:hypothetical protein